MDRYRTLKRLMPFLVMALVGLPLVAQAGEADIKIPDLTQVKFDGRGGIGGLTLM